MRLSNFKWYRNLMGGTWQQFTWYALGKRHKEWRKVHNGRFTEYIEDYTMEFPNPDYGYRHQIFLVGWIILQKYRWKYSNDKGITWKEGDLGYVFNDNKRIYPERASAVDAVKQMRNVYVNDAFQIRPVYWKGINDESFETFDR